MKLADVKIGESYVAKYNHRRHEVIAIEGVEERYASHEYAIRMSTRKVRKVLVDIHYPHNGEGEPVPTAVRGHVAARDLVDTWENHQARVAKRDALDADVEDAIGKLDAVGVTAREGTRGASVVIRLTPDRARALAARLEGR